jgi:hypothetical protein
MRSLIAVTASVTMLLGQVPLVPAYAQSAPPAPQAATQYPIIAATFNAFPNGGDPLSTRIANLIIANPKLAPEFVIYMRNTEGLSKAQKLAAEHGLAAAADRFGIKAADYGVVTKDGIVAATPVCDWYCIGLAILALGAIAGGIAYGAENHNNNNTPFVPPSPPVVSSN